MKNTNACALRLPQRTRSTKSLITFFGVFSALFTCVAGQEIGRDICACSPGTYVFTFDFSLSCPPINVTVGDGIRRTSCLISPFGTPITDDLVPVRVRTIDVLEIGQDLRILVQEQIEGNFEDGDSFQYSSIASMADEISTPVDIPRAIQLTIVGSNQLDESIINVFILSFTNDCEAYPVLIEGQSGGWTKFTALEAPNSEFCPAATSIGVPTVPPIADTQLPTSMPTLSPVVPTEAPTVTPTSSAPIISPTTLPTGVPTSAQTGVSAAPTITTSAPTVATAPPTVATSAPTVQTTAPTLATAAPTTSTLRPTVTTPVPTAVTAAPTVTTDAPTASPAAPTITPTSAPTIALTAAPVVPTSAPIVPTTLPNVSPAPSLAMSMDTEFDLEDMESFMGDDFGRGRDFDSEDVVQQMDSEDVTFSLRKRSKGSSRRDKQPKLKQLKSSKAKGGKGGSSKDESTGKKSKPPKGAKSMDTTTSPTPPFPTTEAPVRRQGGKKRRR